MTDTMVVIAIFAGAVIVVVGFLMMMEQRPALGEPGHEVDDDAVDTAAMRVLMREHGLMHLYTALGSPPNDVARERAKIDALRPKIAAMPPGREKRAYERWLRSAAHGADEAERSWAKARYADSATKAIRRPTP